MKELLIWLDEQNGEVIGYGDKLETHIYGIYHRAFSIFICDRKNGKILIQKRDRSKYHSGGLLSNSCCSHLYQGETWEDAIKRCILAELGISLSKQTATAARAGVFTYKRKVGELIEFEEDNVFVVCPSSEALERIRPQRDEVEEIYYLSLDEIERRIEDTPIEFTVWFKEAYELAKELLINTISNDHI